MGTGIRVAKEKDRLTENRRIPGNPGVTQGTGGIGYENNYQRR